DFFDDCAMHISQSEVAALVFERQACMVNAQRMEDRCVKIVDMHRILSNIVGIIICLPQTVPRLYASSRHPDRKAARMVVAAVIVSRHRALAIHRATEFSGPDD